MLGAEPSKLAMGQSPIPPRIGVAIGCLCYRSSEQLRLIRKVMQCQLCAVRNIYEHCVTPKRLNHRILDALCSCCRGGSCPKAMTLWDYVTAPDIHRYW